MVHACMCAKLLQSCPALCDHLDSVQFSCSVVSDTLQPDGLQPVRLPSPSPTPGVYSNSCPLSQWCHLPSHPLSSPSPPSLNLSQHQSLFQWVSSSHWVAKELEFQLQHQSFNEQPWLISLRMDWLDLPAVPGTLKSLLQHHSSKASILWLSLSSVLYSSTFTSIHDYWKNHSSD